MRPRPANTLGQWRIRQTRARFGFRDHPAGAVQFQVGSKPSSMNPKSFMIIAGEASGDILAAELVEAIRNELMQAEPIYTTDYQPLYGSFEPRFFGAGGPRLAEAGVELAFDMTVHSVTGFSDPLKHYFKFR